MFFFNSSKYSEKSREVTKSQIRKLCSWAGLDNLRQNESKLVEEAVINKMKYSGKISLNKVNRVLKKMKNEHLISSVDKKSLMKRFEDFYEKFN